jgi:Ser/Thr protein kinase RdoA (MazF antagonist)
LTLLDTQIAALLETHHLGPLRRWRPVVRAGIIPTYIVNGILVLRFDNREPERVRLRKEAALYQRLTATTELPVPRVLALDTSHAILPYDVIILEWLPGVPALNIWKQLDLMAQQQISYDLGQALARLHNVTCSGYGGFDRQSGELGYAPDWQSYLLDRAAETLVVLWQHDGLPAPLLEGAERYLLRTFIPVTPPPVVVHGDFGLHNALVEQRGATWRLSGLIDLEWSLAADATYEFATGLLIEPDEVNPLPASFLAGYRSLRLLDTDWVQRSAVYRLIYHLTLCGLVCRHYDGDPQMMRYHRGMIVDILKAYV